jgi:hypothetical protein
LPIDRDKLPCYRSSIPDGVQKEVPMLIVMSLKATKEQLDAVVKAVEAMGLRAAPIPGSERTAVGVLGNEGYVTI